jgi:hypothetical protein
MTLLTKIFVSVLTMALTSCAAFESGGAFNPKLVRATDSIIAKAGTDTSLRIFAGDISRLGLRPGELFTLNSRELSMSGRTTVFAPLRLADLTYLVTPTTSWKFGIATDGVELIANSSSVIAFDDTIRTVTRVELGEYSINASLKVPDGTAPGNYTVQARVNIRGSSPVMLQWIVNVVPK